MNINQLEQDLDKKKQKLDTLIEKRNKQWVAMNKAEEEYNKNFRDTWVQTHEEVEVLQKEVSILSLTVEALKGTTAQ